MSLVGRPFPNITVDAISEMGDNLRINVLEEATKNQQKVLLFWYPKDFTFVCPTELHAFQEALGEFEKRNTKVIGASCDTNEVHFAWLNTPKDNGGIEGVTYPILADTHRQLANALGIVDQDFDYDEEGNEILSGSNVTYRATYLLAGILNKLMKMNTLKLIIISFTFLIINSCATVHDNNLK
ncbi:redoxin domain-containing protein, partial [Riemerella anatipestifer]|uniref:redoxin domain-containing protein n=1 Tax=Riemerella anatipestifer TaxID=34085 RepID=UPI0023646FFD